MLQVSSTRATSPGKILAGFDDMLELMAQDAANLLADNAPGIDLPKIFLGSIYKIREGYWVVGKYSDLGSAPEDPAPKGTIKEFLRDHPEYKSPPGVQYWHAPWWYLPQDAKRLLHNLRRQGQYGGVAGKAPYWHVIDTGHGRPAWVKGEHYVQKTTQEIQYIMAIRNRDFMGGVDVR